MLPSGGQYGRGNIPFWTWGMLEIPGQVGCFFAILVLLAIISYYLMLYNIN